MVRVSVDIQVKREGLIFLRLAWNNDYQRQGYNHFFPSFAIWIIAALCSQALHVLNPSGASSQKFL
jgi:hypothetical protein